MTNSKVLDILRRGGLARVTAVSRLAEPWLAELIGRVGFDGVWYDLEHRTPAEHTADAMAVGCRAAGIDLMVRVRKSEYGFPMRMLEIGANGLMVPHIRSAEEARQWVEWCRFAPLGRRGFDGAGADADFMLASPLDHMRQANEQVFLAFQIEDREAVDSIDDIAAVRGYDVLFVGPGDLSVSLGVPFEFDHPLIEEAIARVAAAATLHGKWWGLPVGSAEEGQRFLEQGARLLARGSDHVLLVEGYRRLAAEMATLDSPAR